MEEKRYFVFKLRKYSGWIGREISAKEDEAYFNEDDDDDIFKKRKENEEEDFEILNLPDSSEDFLGKKISSHNDLIDSFTEEGDDICDSSKIIFNF